MRLVPFVAILSIGLGCQQKCGPMLPTQLSNPPAYHPAPPAEGAVTLKVVKWPELEKAISDLKGKIVVIDIWADYCGPCKEKFPHFVELHEKYHDLGVACISVAVDEASEAEACRTFLNKKKAVFANYLIDEPGEVWEAKLDSGPPPTVLVFGRDGKRVKKFTTMDAFTYADVEKMVVELVAGK